MAQTASAVLAGTANHSAPAAVLWVKLNLPANTTAQRLTTEALNRTACPHVTERGRCGADVAAGAAVVRIPIHGDARPVADESALDAPVMARSLNASALLEGSRVVTRGAAASAVFEIAVQIGAVTAATVLERGTTGVASTTPTEAAGVAVARPAGREALIPLRPVGTPIAEGLARVPASPGGPHPPRTEHRAG